MKMFIRQFRKARSVLLLNMAGLTTGMAFAILGFMFLVNESSFDQMHEHGDRIYRLYKKNVNINDGTQTLTAETSGLMGPTLANDYPEVEQAVRILPWFDETVISYQDMHQKSGLVLFADSTFFDIFSFNLVRGNPSDALVRPRSIVLTESLANRLFGEADPLGKTVLGLHDLEYEVTGIVSDAPGHSHIRYDALISWSTTVPGTGPLEYDFMNNWLGQTVFTYLLMASGTDVSGLENKMEKFMERHFPERSDSYFLFFQPLKEVYMGSSDIRYNRTLRIGNPQYTYIFMAAALFVLLIACINYINLQTARAARRGTEIGIRKVLGAARRQLAVHFFSETLLFVLFSGLLAVLLVDILLPYFNVLAGVNISSALLWDARIITGIAMCIVLTAFLAGTYPALVLASGAPFTSYRTATSGRSSILPRKVLITFQYTISVILIICSLVMFLQTRFMMNMNLGFNPEQLLVLNINNGIDEHHEEFVSRIRRHPDIRQATVSQSSIGTGWFGTTILPEGSERPLSVSIFRIGADFFTTMDVKKINGHLFQPGSPQDSAAVVINEALAGLLGYDDPVGHTIRFGPEDPPQRIIGVVEDFHYEPVNKQSVRPTVMMLYPRNMYNVTLRIEEGRTAGVLSFLEDIWIEYEDRFPFDYYFVSEWFREQYGDEQRLLRTILMYAGVSVLLSFLGLYGLMTHLIDQRLKEFSIRKVLGASHFGITMSVNRGLAMLVFVGCFVGIPVAWWVTQGWLEDFPHRIGTFWWVFPAAGMMILLLTLATVSFKFWRSARVNPADILRNE